MFLMMPDEWNVTLKPKKRGRRRRLGEQPARDALVTFHYSEHFRPFPKRAEVLKRTQKAVQNAFGERFIVTRLRDGLRVDAEVTRAEAINFLASEFLNASDDMANLTIGRIFTLISIQGEQCPSTPSP